MNKFPWYGLLVLLVLNFSIVYPLHRVYHPNDSWLMVVSFVTGFIYGLFFLEDVDIAIRRWLA